MIPSLEMRNFIYSTAMSIPMIFFVILVNFSRIKKKTQLLGVPSLFFVKKFTVLAQKNKIFKPLSSKYFWAFWEIFLVTATHLLSSSVLAGGFAKLVGTDGNFFGFLYFAPFLFCSIFFALWQNPLKNLDYFAFSVPVALIFMKCGCFFSGCCNSVWWPGGMYNYVTRREEIPIQLVEAFWALLTFVIIVIYDKKVKTRKDGEIFPLVMILIGGTRFISEFWRDDLLVWGNFRYFHLFCAISVVLGLIYFILVRKYSDKITLKFENCAYFSRKLRSKIK